MRPSAEFAAHVEAVIALVPAGTVVTYGEVAADAGFPGAARAVGNVLAGSQGLPWWRVVTATGRLVPGMEQRHAQLLRAEGVPVRDRRVAPEALRPAPPRPSAGRRPS